MLSSPLFITRMKGMFTQTQLDNFLEKLQKLFNGEIVYFDVIEERIIKEMAKGL